MKMIYFSSIQSECHFVLSLLREAGSDVRREREEIKTRSERREKAEYKTLFCFTTSIRTVTNLQRYSTDTNGIILAHMPHLMGAVFCVWCGICAKYLAFGTYPTSTVGALTMAKYHHIFLVLSTKHLYI